jgi:peptide/nickel transport system substrate-binding protein
MVPMSASPSRSSQVPRHVGVKSAARRVAIVALGALLLLATGGAGWASAEGVTVRFVPHAGLKVLDPVWSTAYIVRNHAFMIYDQLFAVDASFHPHPQMVDKWTRSPDGLVYTFTLRPGLKWHDGAPVTARDCVASIKRWEARDTLGVKLASFTKSLEPTNAATFTLTLKEPFGLVLDALAKPSGNALVMMPERVALTDPQKQIEDYTGSGPFKFVAAEFKPGEKAVYEKFKDYIPRDEPADGLSGGKRVYVDRVEWITISDASTAISALNAGEIDVDEAPPVDLFPILKANPKVVVQIFDPLGLQGALRFNHLTPPFNNPKMRQAVYDMINQEDVMRLVVGDPSYMRACPTIFICDTPYATTAGTENIRYDPEKAKEQLKAAGYNGEKVVLIDPTDLYVLHAMVGGVVPMLRKGGLNVEVAAMDWSTAVTRRVEKKPTSEGGWNLFVTAWTAVDLVSPLTNGNLNALCEKGNYGWYCDPKLTELQNTWAVTTDPARSKALASDIQREAYASGAYVPLGQYQQPGAFRGITGIVPAPVPVFWNIRKG